MFYYYIFGGFYPPSSEWKKFVGAHAVRPYVGDVFNFELKGHKCEGTLSSRTMPTSKDGKGKLNIWSINDFLQKTACSLVFDCLHGSVCFPFKNYLNHNAANTRNNGKSAKLPKVKLDFVRQSFYFLGASIFGGDHFTKEGHQKATCGKNKIGALMNHSNKILK